MSWPFATLSSLCEINMGKTPSRHNPAYWGEGHPWLSIADMNQGVQICDTKESITQTAVDECGCKPVEPGTVLLSFKLSIGKVGIANRRLFTNEAIAALPVKNPNQLDIAYLSYALCALNLTDGLDRAAKGLTLNKDKLERIKVPLPPLSEQRRIATILDQATALRAKRREALAQLDELQRTIFMEMFGDPVTSPKECVSSTLGDCVEEMQYGPRFYNEAYSEEGVRIVRITDLNTAGSLDFDAMPRMDVDAETQTKFVLSAGDIVFARTGATVGKVALMREGDPPCIAGAYFIRMRFQKHIIPEYAYSVLQSSSVQSLIAGQSRQAAQQNFSGPGLRRLPMPIPAVERQTQFAQTLEAIRSEKIKHMNGLGLVNDLFSSLQHRAFRGEL